MMKIKIISAFLCLFIALTANAAITWGTGAEMSAANVSIGSSKGAYIDVKFSTTTAVTNGSFTITLPRITGIDFTSTVENKGNSTGGTSSVAPSSGQMVMTISGIVAPANTIVQYRVYQTALSTVAALNGAKIVVKTLAGVGNFGASTAPDMLVNYIRPNLSIVAPTVLPPNQTGLVMNFGTNNRIQNPTTYTPQTYKLQLKNGVGAGSIDSVYVQLKVQTHSVIFYYLTIEGIRIMPDKITVTQTSTIPTAVAPNTTTYSFWLKKHYFPGSDGLDAGESVELAVDVYKQYQGNTIPTLTIGWGPKFGENPVTGTNPSFNSPTLSPPQAPTVAGILTGTTESNGLYAMDGSLVKMTTKLFNNTSGIGTIKELVLSVALNNSVEYPVLMDTVMWNGVSTNRGIRYRIKHAGMMGDWKRPERLVAVNSYTGTSGAGYSFNTQYLGSTKSFGVEILDTFEAGDSLILETYAGYPSDLYKDIAADVNKTKGITTPFQVIPNYYNLAQEYNKAGAITLSPVQIFALQNLTLQAVDGSAFASSFNRNDSKTALVKDIRFNGFTNTGNFTTNAKYVMRIALPKGLRLDNSKDSIRIFTQGLTTNINKWNLNAPTVKETADSIIYSLEIKYANRPSAGLAARNDIYLELINTCNGMSSNDTKLITLSWDYYPTGQVVPGSKTDVVWSKAGQITQDVTMVCESAGIDFTSMTPYRLNIGLKDDDGNGIADLPLAPADRSKIDYSKTMASDTIRIDMQGTMLGNFNQLYAVVFNNNIQSNIKFLANKPPLVLVNGVINPNVTVTAINATDANNVLIPKDQGAAAGSERYAYSWKITKSDQFKMGDLVTISPYFYNNLMSGNIQTKAWLYASENPNITDPTTPVAGDRKGGQEPVMSMTNATTQMFSNANNSQINYYVGPGYNTIPSLQCVIGGTSNGSVLPYEYRHLGTIDVITFKAPIGYQFPDNTFTFEVENYSGTGFSIRYPISLQADPSSTVDKKTFVFGSSVFDVNHTGDPTKIPLPDAGYSIKILNTRIRATNSAPAGSSGVDVYYKTDITSYTQTVIPGLLKDTIAPIRSGVIPLHYTDPGRVGLRSGTSTNFTATGVQVTNQIYLGNTTADDNAYEVWVYLKGNVQDAYMVIGADTIKGQGEGKRWLHVTKPIPSGSELATLISYTNLNGVCDASTNVTLYPIYNFNVESGETWVPFGKAFGDDLTDADFDVNSDYTYVPLNFTINNVPSKISGTITPLATTPLHPQTPTDGTSYGETTVAVQHQFPIEFVFSAEGGVSSIINTRVQTVFPKGLKYVEGSAYLQTPKGVVKVGTALENLLKTLVGGTQSTTLNIKLENAGLLYGEILGGTVCKLNFLLEPTCDINMTPERINANFYANRPCLKNGLVEPATGNGVAATSSYLYLRDYVQAFTAEINEAKLSSTGLTCNQAKNSTIVTIGWKKTYDDKIGLASYSRTIGVRDSMRVTMPVAVNVLNDSIHYTYPASNDGVVPSQTGMIDKASVRNKIVGGIRIITWPLPYAYFDALAAHNAAVQNNPNTYTAKLIFTQDMASEALGDIHAALVSETNPAPPEIGCSPQFFEIINKTIPIVMATPNSTWTGAAGNNDWTNLGNWTGGVPSECTNIIISSTAPIFPVIAVGYAALCDTVRFEADAEIGNVTALTYSKALVDLKMKTNMWNLVSAPLQCMYSGDYMLAKVGNPFVYMRKYQSQDYMTGLQPTVGKWTVSFNNTNILLPAGLGYATWIDDDSNSTRTFNFPKDSMSYDLHDINTGVYSYTEYIPSNPGRANNHRFTYESLTSFNAATKEFTIDVENSSNTVFSQLLVGNPFMSHLDFGKFQAANNTKIQGTFYVWGGLSFEATIQGQNGTVQTGTTTTDQYISPQQSFIVMRNGSADASALKFMPNMSVANVGGHGLRAESANQETNTLKLNVYRDRTRHSGIVVKYDPQANNSFDSKEDAWTIFPGSSKTSAVLYSLINGRAASINTITTTTENVDLGINSTTKGMLTFIATGTETFNGDIFLFDAKSGQIQDLKKNQEYEFNNVTGNVEGRFSLIFHDEEKGGGISTDLNDVAEGRIAIYTENGQIFINSSDADPINNVVVLDIQGRTIWQRSNIAESKFSFALGDSQLVIVKVQTNKKQQTEKVMYKLQ